MKLPRKKQNRDKKADSVMKCKFCKHRLTNTLSIKRGAGATCIKKSQLRLFETPKRTIMEKKYVIKVNRTQYFYAMKKDVAHLTEEKDKAFTFHSVSSADSFAKKTFQDYNIIPIDKPKSNEHSDRD